jgi:carbon storage regulator
MLVLSRKKDEQIVITLGSEHVWVKVVEVRGDRVRLGIEAPDKVSVHRQEVFDALGQWQPKPTLVAAK